MRFSIENQNPIRQRVPIDAFDAHPATRSRNRATLIDDAARDARHVARRARNPHRKRIIVVSHPSSRLSRRSQRARHEESSPRASEAPSADRKFLPLIRANCEFSGAREGQFG